LPISPEPSEPALEQPGTTPTQPVMPVARSQAITPPLVAPPAESPPVIAEPPSRTPIDWYAEARASANAVDERNREARRRRSFGRAVIPNQRSSKESFHFFTPKDTKKGLIEEHKDIQEVWRWVSDRCYQIVVSPDVMRRGQNRCFIPLGKRQARGDLFEHMNDVDLPEDEVPPEQR
jgi:hypothetical protein